MRHGPAMPHGTATLADTDRPLTDQGRTKTRKAAQGLKQLVSRWEVILTSPLKRARQTADIVAEVYEGDCKVETFSALMPGGSAESIATRLKQISTGRSVLLVGHQPDFGGLINRWIGAPPDTAIALKKPGVAMIALSLTPHPQGELRWLLAPKHLRLLA